eukprot:TRINITY_DN52800_c0_g1_i1.p1 TRINITY_DN52800_c0_g1~~TRINITY_DN52800_c0_g1_i1.p1  ORF type:complete len:384 (-),score=37.87 TRINITY_DN52800_c0_g1_i1:56-1207(-)
MIGNVQQLAIAARCSGGDGMNWLLEPLAFIPISKEHREANVIVSVVLVVIGSMMVHFGIIRLIIVLRKWSPIWAYRCMFFPSVQYMIISFLLPGLAVASFDLLLPKDHVPAGFKILGGIAGTACFAYCFALIALCQKLVPTQQVWTQPWENTPMGNPLEKDQLPMTKFLGPISYLLPQYYWCSPQKSSLLNMHASLLSSYSPKRLGYMYVAIHSLLLIVQCLVGSQIFDACKNQIIGISIISGIKTVGCLLWRPFNSICKDVVAALMMGTMTMQLSFAAMQVEQSGRTAPLVLAKTVEYCSMMFSSIYGILVLLEVIKEVLIIKKLERLDEEWENSDLYEYEEGAGTEEGWYDDYDYGDVSSGNLTKGLDDIENGHTETYDQY